MLIECNDVLKWAASYDGPKYHALLTDTPYELGFMGRAWDKSGIAFNSEMWAALAQHLYPGAWGMAFASSRGSHRLAVAIEDAGLVIHPFIFGWGVGSGFPKATRIDTQIDKRAGVEQDKIEYDRYKDGRARLSQLDGKSIFDGRNGNIKSIPVTNLARAWDGHRYGRQNLKPALEPIVVFQKPYEGKPVDNMIETGAGALWIDGGRIIHNEPPKTTIRNAPRYSGITMNNGRRGGQQSSIGSAEPSGRWPANLVLQHTPDCADVCVPDCPVARLGEMSGESVSKASQRGAVNMGTFGGIAQGDTRYQDIGEMRGHDDTGTAARFFYNGDWMYERLERTDAVAYFAKASVSEREAGLDPAQMRLMREWYGADEDNPDDETPYEDDDNERRNTHETVKPISLTRHLATLLLPPALYAPRRLLNPFTGSGSEPVGAALAGWEFVHGIELREQYVNIARARLAYWQQMGYKFNAGQPIKIKINKRQSAEQVQMF